MSWHRVDDCWPDHPRFEGLDAGEVAFWFALLAYCSRNQTDGVVSTYALKRIRFCTPKRIEKLRQRELIVDARDGHVSLRDYLDYQDSKAATRAKREQWRERQSRHRSRVTPSVSHGESHASTKPDHTFNPTVVDDQGSKNGGKKSDQKTRDLFPQLMRERWVSDRVLDQFQPADVPILVASWKNTNDLRDSGRAIEEASNPRAYALSIANRTAGTP